MCPHKDWGDDWRNVSKRFDSEVAKSTIKRMDDGRSAIGNGVGNLRLIDSSENRRLRDTDVVNKMNLASAGPDAGDETDMKKFAFPPHDRALWLKVSKTDKGWNNTRLGAFQEAVEQRSEWLYRRFYYDLQFEDWHLKNDTVPIKAGVLDDALNQSDRG